MSDLSKLENTINLKFKNKDLLKQSLVHRSYLNEHSKFDLGHNERLEFLGDAVLEIITTEYLFHRFPKKPEGELTNWRASLVNSKMLANVAEEIKLENHMFLSKGEASDKNVKARQYILANAVEALIGAIYLDQGIKEATNFVKKYIISKLDYILSNKLYLDPKSTFQEKAQEYVGITPHYSVISETGPDHDKVFEIGLFLNKELIAKGKGNSKQEAQIDAAINGLKTKEW